MAFLPLNITDKDKILVIAPHPDDECIGVGGILALYPKHCDIIVMTDGRYGKKGILPNKECIIRKEQFINEMEYIKVNDYKWFGYEDGNLMGKKDCMQGIRFDEYTKIFLPWGDDNHPDHTATFVYAMNQIREMNVSADIYQYEVHVPLHDVTTYIDITGVLNEKIDLIRFHKDQIEQHCYDEIVKSLAKYRACQANNAGRYYETYLKTELCQEVSEKNMEREKTIQKYKLFYRTLILWLKIKQSGKKIAKFLNEKDIRRITVYGFADLGKLLYEELRQDNYIEIVEVIDKGDIKLDLFNLKTVKPEQGQRNVDMVVVTPVSYFDEIKSELSKLGYENVYSLEKILEEMAIDNARQNAIKQLTDK